MRELHVVAVSEDGRHVLLASRRGTVKTTYRVALDETLLAAVRGDLPRPGGDVPTASDLTPKEIQARLRAGESAASIAAAAGVPITRVERFSGPVQGEMARVIDAARDSYVVRGRLGRSALTLGAAVDQALSAQPGLRAESTEWSTYREEDGTWKVTVRWFARARLREASWVYDPAAKGPAPRQVAAVDPGSAALGHATDEATAAAPKAVPKTAPKAAPKPAPKAAPKRAAAKAAPAKRTAPARQAPAKRAAATQAPTTKAAAKPATKKPATKKPATKRAPATTAPAQKAQAPKATAVKAPTTAPAKRAPAQKALAPKPAVKQLAKQPPRARTLRVVPDPAPVRKKVTSAERDGVTNRAVVPGWADVLLGTTPGSDR